MYSLVEKRWENTYDVADHMYAILAPRSECAFNRHNCDIRTLINTTTPGKNDAPRILHN